MTISTLTMNMVVATASDTDVEHEQALKNGCRRVKIVHINNSNNYNNNNSSINSNSTTQPNPLSALLSVQLHPASQPAQRHNLDATCWREVNVSARTALCRCPISHAYGFKSLSTVIPLA